jgi:L-seryl-tRNA(Ser) seleniumtransferase
MMLFYNNNNSLGAVRDEQFVALGRKHGVVTMNDCAADVPPVENLWKYTAMGFDLVAFSGGKGIRGPQSAGLLVGRKDLIAAARANASPNGNSIGRGMKVNKEEMLGMLAALERYLKLDHAALDREFQRRAEVVLKSLAGLPGVTATITVPEVANHVPHVAVKIDQAAAGITGQEVSRRLREGTPSIGVRPGDELMIGVWMMEPGEDKVVARRLREVFEKKA